MQIANALVKRRAARLVAMTKQFSSNYPGIKFVDGTLYCSGAFAFASLLRNGRLFAARSIGLVSRRKQSGHGRTVRAVPPGVDRNVSITVSDPLKSRLRNRRFVTRVLFAARVYGTLRDRTHLRRHATSMRKRTIFVSRCNTHFAKLTAGRTRDKTVG